MNEFITIASTPIYVSKPDTKAVGGLILIHEVWGMNDHIRNIADRLAEQGYLVYAPDLLRHTGIQQKISSQLQLDFFNPEKRNQVQPKMRELMAPLQAPDFAKNTVTILRQVFDGLYSLAETNQKVAVIGFCFGGTYSYNLAIAEPKLVAAVPYYGHCDQSIGELRENQTPILAFYGENDEALVSKLPDLENRMHQADVDFSYRLYAGCGHAFFNDTNPYAYNEAAAKDSWQRTLDFLNSKF